MYYVFLIGQSLLVLALLGFIGVVAWLIMTALKLKNAVMNDAKRLYQRPLNSGKNLVATGKGIVQQETVRFKHIAGSVKGAAGAVKETVVETKFLVQSVRFSDLKPAIGTLQNFFKILGVAAQFTRASSKSG